ncbi:MULTISPECIES: adenosylmethionine decarboxylase [Leptospirillum]|uniref:S-adenosylmethionine decarboxylase proenzyme n=3 Tax=Leptospirillum ferriphilum TaxID=178606 RepID=A0A059XTJ1_9BACT|nr:MULTISPECIES: adenosylmethionine decarboxylase [Leptospirillum]EAY55693.1 MAG: putative S-adenosylmethionine decarboxylase [Leptospirillum rubarum]EIJ77154.1 MAG: Putative S-adenosylmethionine decarboxylase [Leptospirillum sp. Group II 'C75']AFS53342.1 S-adenosylmethionine decarboxylase [Leptospirillum ferriphilum ML-04]AIA30375.1 S-adenosylmethionine decarboxylase [Leptospirillum ferriphilum YSK]AKS23713.1 S-adenosylmethionine decarboxylase [Leptospirillum sp. Group II 'CF-1']
MHALGTHLLVELKDCQNERLNDVSFIRQAMLDAALEAKATIVDERFHEFSPFGVSGVVVIAESHLAIHTWPEYRYAAVDIFTCGDTLKPEVAALHLAKKFVSNNPSIHEVKRGIIGIQNEKVPHKTPGNEIEQGTGEKGKNSSDERSKDFEVVY